MNGSKKSDTTPVVFITDNLESSENSEKTKLTQSDPSLAPTVIQLDSIPEDVTGSSAYTFCGTDREMQEIPSVSKLLDVRNLKQKNFSHETSTLEVKTIHRNKISPPLEVLDLETLATEKMDLHHFHECASFHKNQNLFQIQKIYGSKKRQTLWSGLQFSLEHFPELMVSLQHSSSLEFQNQKTSTAEQKKLFLIFGVKKNETLKFEQVSPEKICVYLQYEQEKQPEVKIELEAA